MAIQLKCRDITEINCDYVLSADTAEEAKQEINQHIDEEHPDLTQPEKTRIEQRVDEMF